MYLYLLQADIVREAGNTLTAFSGLDLIIVAILIIVSLLIIKLLPQYIDKKTEIKMLEINKQNEQMEIETNALVKETSHRLEKLEYAISNLSKNKNSEKNILKSLIYNENVPIKERLESFNEYLKLGGNGNCKNFAVKMIVENKQLWNCTLNNEEQTIENINKYYDESINEIKRKIY